MLYGVGKLGAKAKSGAVDSVTPGVSGPEANSFEFDLSKATPVQDTNAYLTGSTAAIQFNSDGTKLFRNALASTTLEEINLSTAYDITTKTGSSTSHTLDYQAGGIKFADSGNKFYTMYYNATGAIDAVVQYDLSTAYDMTTASYVRQVSVHTLSGGLNTHGIGIDFKTDGTRMFVWDFLDDAWYRYNLSTAFDISTATYNSLYDVGIADTYVTYFSSDGQNIYYVKDEVLYQRTLSSAWGLGSISSPATELSKREINFMYGVNLTPDGTKFYLFGSGGIYQSSVATAYDITTSRFDITKSYKKSSESSYYGIFFKPDGTKLFYTHASEDKVKTADLSVPWDVSSGVDDSVLDSFDVSSYETIPHELFFKPDGTEMYQVGRTGDDVNQYTLSTAWDVTSATFTRLFSVSTQETNPTALTFKSDGTKMYVGGIDSDKVHEYDLSTAWDISTASLNGSSSTISNIYGIALNDDGTKIYLTTSTLIYEYTMSTAYDITTMSLTHTLTPSGLAGGGTNVYAIYYKQDGSRFFFGTSSSGILEYSTDSKQMVEQIYSPPINIIESTAETGTTGDYTGNYDVLDIEFLPDSLPSDFSGRLYIGHKLKGSASFDLCIGAVQVLNSSEARVYAWQGTDFNNWQTTTSNSLTSPSSYTDVTNYTYSDISPPAASASLWIVSSTGTASLNTGAADGVSTTYGSGGSAVLPVRGLDKVAQTASTSFVFTESSDASLANGDYIWMRSPSVTLSSGLHHLRIAYNFTTNSGSAKMYDTLQLFWAGA